jgi:hypothetical protein
MDCPDEIYLQTIHHGVLGRPAWLPEGRLPEGIMAQTVKSVVRSCGCVFHHAQLYNPGPVIAKPKVAEGQEGQG